MIVNAKTEKSPPEELRGKILSSFATQAKYLDSITYNIFRTFEK
jgi:hypothetical protein